MNMRQPTNGLAMAVQLMLEDETGAADDAENR